MLFQDVMSRSETHGLYAWYNQQRLYEKRRANHAFKREICRPNVLAQQNHEDVKFEKTLLVN